MAISWRIVRAYILRLGSAKTIREVLLRVLNRGNRMAVAGERVCVMAFGHSAGCVVAESFGVVML
jgi:hypothetical protein